MHATPRTADPQHTKLHAAAAVEEEGIQGGVGGDGGHEATLASETLMVTANTSYEGDDATFITFNDST